MNEDYPQAKQEDIDAVTAYIPILSDPSFSFGEWRTLPGQFPHYFFSPKANQLIDALGKLMIVFDWPAWKDKATLLMENTDALANADLLTLRKLITTHLRAERFNEGHLAGQYKSGHLLGILEGLETLRDQV